MRVNALHYTLHLILHIFCICLYLLCLASSKSRSNTSVSPVTFIILQLQSFKLNISTSRTTLGNPWSLCMRQAKWTNLLNSLLTTTLHIGALSRTFRATLFSFSLLQSNTIFSVSLSLAILEHNCILYLSSIGAVHASRSFNNMWFSLFSQEQSTRFNHCLLSVNLRAVLRCKEWDFFFPLSSRWFSQWTKKRQKQ